MLRTPFYNPAKSYEDNFIEGPFGDFAVGDLTLNPSPESGEGLENFPSPHGGEGLGERSSKAPRYNFLGFKVFSPFGIPAGPLINGKFVKAALDKGFDIVTYKTVRTVKHPCHPWPNVLSVNLAHGNHIADTNYQEPLSITNSFGVPSPDPEFWQRDLQTVVSQTRRGQVVIGSFQGTKDAAGDVSKYIADFRKGAKLVKETGAAVLEVNLSCPNEGTGHLLCFDIDRSKRVVEAIRDEINKTPLIIKIAYYPDDSSLEKFIKEVGVIADAISAINTITAKIILADGSQALPGEGRLYSGVCGHSIKWAGLDMVQRLSKLKNKLSLDYQIMGVGGVNKPSDYQEYIEAGANIVMSATGAMWNPYLASDVKDRYIFKR